MAAAAGIDVYGVSLPDAMLLVDALWVYELSAQALHRPTDARRAWKLRKQIRGRINNSKVFKARKIQESR